MPGAACGRVHDGTHCALDGPAGSILSAPVTSVVNTQAPNITAVTIGANNVLKVEGSHFGDPQFVVVSLVMWRVATCARA